MKSKNVIEINGKLYDARTGMNLNAAKKTKPATAQLKKATSVTAKNTAQPKSVDGFMRQTGGTTKLHPVKKPTAVVSTPKTTTHNGAKKSKNRETAAAIKLKTKRSTTLNRSFVSAPHIISESPAETFAVVPEEVSSTALKQADAKRLERAKQVSMSSVISRFSSTPVVEKPKTVNTKGGQKPQQAATTTKNDASEVASKAKHTSTKERLIKTALENAVAQHAPKNTPAVHKKTKKHHVARYTSTALAALLLAAYVAYLNVPSISMKVAAHRAGFAANLPTYKPAGYSLRGPIAYSPGQVTLNFASNTDQRKFMLKQQPTTWDSTALLENYVAKKSSNYLTYQDSGLTIYILDNGDAAWVNGGKFYRVEASKASLDTNQLLKLATGA